MSEPGRPGRREIARQAFHRALGDKVPDLSRLENAIPAIIAEARRRRRGPEAPTDLISAAIPLATRAIPRLAAATLVLIVLATVIGLRGDSETGGGTAGLDRFLLTGDLSGAGSDLLLETITAGGNRDE
jgi:hypothetical protein